MNRTRPIGQAGAVDAAAEPVARTPPVAVPGRLRRVFLWMTGFILICFLFFVPFPMGPNESAHVVLTISIVDHATFTIDPYAGLTQDLAFHKGHYYINKAPGQSMLGVPVYLVFKAAFHSVSPPALGTISPAYKSYILLVYAESICTVAIPGVLLLALFFWFLGFFTESLLHRTLLTLALGLGTMMFRYADTVYSHVPVTGILFAAFVLIWLLDRRPDNLGRRSRWFVDHPPATTVLVGLLLGASVLLEYSVIPITLLLGVYGLMRLPRDLWPYLIAGTLPGALIVTAYNTVSFGNPLLTGYANTTSAFPGVHHHRAGASGAYQHVLHVPTAHALWGMSFSPYRGLFFLSPFLLLAFPGYWLWSRRNNREWILFAVIPFCQFLAIGGFGGWYGGLAVGPRYLIPLLPFLAFPVIFVLDRARELPGRLVAYGLLALSFAAVWIESTGGAAYPGRLASDPLFSYSLPALKDGYLRTNVVSLVLFLSDTLSQFSHTLVSLWGAILLLALLGIWSFAWRSYDRTSAAG